MSATPAPAETARPARAADLPGLCAWHAGWATLCAGVALAFRLGGAPLQGFESLALLIMVIPGLGGLALLWRDGRGQRAMLIGLWIVASVASLAVSGGVTGSYAAFAFAPLAAGIALGGYRRALAGAAGGVIGGAAGLLAALWGGASPTAPWPGLAALVLTAGAFAAALAMAWRGRERRLIAAETALGRLETLLAAQPGLTLVLDGSGRVASAYGTSPVGLSVEALFDQGLIAAVHAPDRPGVLAALDKAATGAEAQCAFTPRLALDRRATLGLRGLPDGRLVASLRDASVQYAREAALEAARVEAEALNAGKSRFLANMSHELRTPLNAVIGFADIMRQQLFGPLPDKYADYATSIHEAGGHLLDLINDVLDVTKIEAEKYELAKEKFDAREPVSAAMTLVRVNAHDKGVELNGMLPPDILMVEADKRALKQMALNLLSNAVKFTPQGGAVTVTLEAVGPYLELVVADTGVGIAPEDLKRLGRPFEQAGDASQKAKGTGLGLSLVRSLAELHGGRMTIESTLGEGAAVTVRLPIVTLARAPAPQGGAEIVPLMAARSGNAF